MTTRAFLELVLLSLCACGEKGFGLGSYGEHCGSPPPGVHCEWDMEACECAQSAPSTPPPACRDDDACPMGYHCIQPTATSSDGCVRVEVACVSDRDCPRDARCAIRVTGLRRACVFIDGGIPRPNECSDDDECRREEGATCFADSCFGPRE